MHAMADRIVGGRAVGPCITGVGGTLRVDVRHRRPDVPEGGANQREISLFGQYAVRVEKNRLMRTDGNVAAIVPKFSQIVICVLRRPDWRAAFNRAIGAIFGRGGGSPRVVGEEIVLPGNPVNRSAFPGA